MKSKKICQIKAKSKSEIEILIYDDIGEGWFGGISAKDFATEIKAHGDSIENIYVRINSPGGSVFDGVAMYNVLAKHKANVIVDIDGLAASIASVIAMAGDEIRMADNALMMIHDPWTVAAGGSADLRDQADLLDKIKSSLVTTYHSKSNMDETEISDLMEAETWMDANEALAYGLIDSVTEEMKMAARFDLSKFKNAPQHLIEATKDVEDESLDDLKSLLRKTKNNHRESIMKKKYEITLPEGSESVKNDANTIDELKERRLEIHASLEAIEATAEAEKRIALTQEEKDEMKALSSEYDDLTAAIDRKERIAAQAQALAASYGPKADKADPGVKSMPRHAVTDTSTPFEKKGKWGWNHFGDFAASVKNAARNGGQVDPRLIQNAPTSFGSEGVGADGGFAVPPDFRSEIMSKVAGEDSLLGRTDQMTSSSNTFTFPKDETTPWQTSGGVQAYWDGEGQQMTQSKLLLEEETVKLNKLTALVPVTAELIEDGTSLDNYLRRRTPEKIDYKVTDAIINGNGVGKPLGLLNAASTVSVAKEGSQAATTVLAANIFKMYSRMYAPCRKNAVWLINQDVEQQLFQMTVVTKNVAGSENVSGSAVYIPAGGISGAPYGTLMGRPVVATQACSTLGSVGDVIFADLSQYMSIVKTGGIRSDVSVHLWFDYDMLAYRFILRVGGQPWWGSAITPASGSANTLGPAVTLAVRS